MANERKYSSQRREKVMVGSDYEGIATMLKDRENEDRIRFYLQTECGKLVSFSIPNNEDWDATIFYYQDLVDAKAKVEIRLKWVAKGNGYYEKQKLKVVASDKAKSRI